MAAEAIGDRLGLGDFSNDVEKSFNFVTQLQRKNGSFPHSRGDYWLLRDSRSYPRYLSMILYHLLLAEGDRDSNESHRRQSGQL